MLSKYFGGHSMEDNKINNLEAFINEIISSLLFWKVNYYCRSMKKLPHGGVINIGHPNIFLKHYPTQTFFYFTSNPEKVPFFMQSLHKWVCEIYTHYKIDLEELLKL